MIVKMITSNVLKQRELIECVSFDFQKFYHFGGNIENNTCDCVLDNTIYK